MDFHRMRRTGRFVTRLLLPATLFAACSDTPTGNEEPTPSSIELSRSSLDFASLGDTAALDATVRDQNGEVMEGVSLTWGSSDPAVASVSGAGIVTATGNGSATVTASAGEADASASVSVEQVADRLRFLPDPVTLETSGDTVTVVATIVDANDHPMPTESVSWAANDTSVVKVSESGVVEAVGDGADSLSVVADGVPGALAAFVGDDQVVIGSVSPSPMIEGDVATIRGLGFDSEVAGNEVTLDGTPAEVTSASSVELRVIVPDANCRPPREGRVRVAARDMVDSTSAEVRPPPEAVQSLAVGDGVYATQGCLHLDSGSTDERYLVGVLSTSEVVSSITPTRLASRTGSRLVAEEGGATETAARSGTGSDGVGSFSAPDGATGDATVTAAPGAPPATTAAALTSLAEARRDRSGEARIRAAEREWLESFGGSTPRLASSSALTGDAPLQRAPPVENETLDLTVPESCDTGVEVDAVVRHVGQAAAFLEDTNNPTSSFTEAQYEDLDGLLQQTTLSTLENNFGSFPDVDDNDLVLVLITKEVNEKENFAGFVFSGDLAPQGECGTSNHAEIFYGRAPDPGGEHGAAMTAEELLVQYPPLIAHELTHILQFTALLTTPDANNRTSWELEGGATLAEQLVGYEVLDDGPRMNLDSADWRDGADPTNGEPGWYRDWVVDMALYFGFKGQDTPPEERAPEECSWIGRPGEGGEGGEGNDGPCENGRAVYGVPSMLFRWVLDQQGETKADDAALMQRLTRSTASGLDVLLEETGETRESLLVQFAATLWADDRPGMGDWLPSWNVHNVFQSVVEEARLRPYTSSEAEPTLEVDVRAASSAYLEWTAPPSHDPTSLRIRSPGDDAAVPEGMVLWVLRIQ